MKRFSLLVVLVGAMLVSSAVVLAQEPDSATPAATGPNVRITITIGDVEGPGQTTERTHRMVTRHGERCEMMMGWRMPIPTTKLDEDGSPVTTYVYQNVGVTARLEARHLSDGRVMIGGQIEASGTREDARPGDSTKPPVIGTFQQVVNVILKDGKPLRIAEVPDPEGGTLYVELQADVLDD